MRFIIFVYLSRKDFSINLILNEPQSFFADFVLIKKVILLRITVIIVWEQSRGSGEKMGDSNS